MFRRGLSFTMLAILALLHTVVPHVAAPASPLVADIFHVPLLG